jgi:hypothetical protein
LKPLLTRKEDIVPCAEKENTITKKIKALRYDLKI